MEDGASLRAADLKKVRLGRYPFKAGIKYFEARKAPYYSASTMEVSVRNLHYMADIIEELKRKGAINSTDPRYIQESDIEEILLVMKRKHLEVATKKKYLSVLSSYLLLWDNDCIRKLTDKKKVLPPKPTKEIRALTVEDISAVLNAADQIEGHIGSVIRGMIALTFATGIRPKESLCAEMKDVDLRGYRFYVRHPKGEEAWATPQWVYMIRGDMIERIIAYIQYRKNVLPGCQYLFPNLKTGKPYSSNMIRKTCRRIAAIAGVDFRMKDLRSSLASITISNDLSRLKAVSLQLRHTQISTTESYYARIQKESVKKEIGSVWKEKPIQ